MKLILSIAVYLLMAAALGSGILLLMLGKPWLLIAAVVVYAISFAKIGCMTH